MIRNDLDSWGSGARVLHWLIALLILLQLGLGWIGHEMERSPEKITLMTAHKSLGITILLLVAVRLAWRWINPVPLLPAGTRAWESALARGNHILLYLLMFAVPLSGWVAASTSIVPWKLWWLVPWPRLAEPDEQLHEVASEWHEALILVLLLLVALHVAAALKHHFLERDRVLERMWKG